MPALIYFVCILGGAIIQTLLRSMLNSGSAPFIPGNVIIYLVVFWVARKWSNSYKKNKEMKNIQVEIIAKHKNDSTDEQE